MLFELRRLRRSPFAAGLLMVFTLGLVLPGVRAEDTPEENARTTRVTVYEVPVLSRIPYLNRLFKNVGVARANGPTADGEEQYERVGIDFDFDMEVVGPGTSRATILRVSGEGCPNACCQDACENVLAICPSKEFASKATDSKDLTGLLMANVRLQTQLEMKEMFESEREEMMNSLVEMAVEKEKLESQLEMVKASAEMVMKMAELKLENETLKMQLKLTEEKQRETAPAVPQVSTRPSYSRRR